MACFISRTVVPSSRLIGSASGFFLEGDDGEACPCTVLALSDALELLRPRSGAARGEDEDNVGITTTTTTTPACLSAPAVLFRRRVHGLVRAVAKLPVKVCSMGRELAGTFERERERDFDEFCSSAVFFRCPRPFPPRRRCLSFSLSLSLNLGAYNQNINNETGLHARPPAAAHGLGESHCADGLGDARVRRARSLVEE